MWRCFVKSTGYRRFFTHDITVRFIAGAALSLLTFTATSCVQERSNQERYPVLGRESVKDVRMIEKPGDVLGMWAKSGRAGKLPVVYLGAKNGLAPAPDEQIKRMRSRFKTGARDMPAQAGRPEGELLAPAGTFLYTAAKLGFAKRVYWVIPYRLLEYSDAERRIKMFLNGFTPPFRAKDIDGMKLDRGCVSGALFDVPVTVCSPESLPAVQEPLHIAVEADFFSRFSSQRRYSALRGMKELFDIMAVKGFQVASAAIVFSSGEGPSHSIHRYLAREAADMLGNVELLKAPAPPDLWAVRDNAASTYSAGLMEELLGYLREPLKRYPDDPALLLFHSLAAASLGREARSADALGMLCRKNEQGCEALLAAGVELKNHRKFRASEAFFRKAVEIRPGWPEAVRVYREMVNAEKAYRGAQHLPAPENPGGRTR